MAREQPVQLLEDQIFDCCACRSYARLLAQRGPFADSSALIDSARAIWWHQVLPARSQPPRSARPGRLRQVGLAERVRVRAQVAVTGWLEALAAHPRIGDVEGLRKKFGAFAEASKQEQSASGASETELQVGLDVLHMQTGACSLLQACHAPAGWLGMPRRQRCS